MERAGPSFSGSSFNNSGTGDQLNAPGGVVNKSTGTGNHLTGSTFHGDVYFGTKEHFDLLRDCLKSLAFPEMVSRSKDIDSAAQGTCEWLLRHKTYTSWASCDRGLLWIKGKPGSGKSTLLRHVLKDITPRLETGQRALVLTFFFHGRGSELQKTPLGLFRSLLHQLLDQATEALKDEELIIAFQDQCEKVGKPGEQWHWHPRDLQRFLESSLLEVLKSRPVWLFVDALDEGGEENAVKLVEDFEFLLQKLPSSNSNQFSICFTCRHYPILNLDGVFEICIEEENQKDISTFVQSKLSSSHALALSPISDLITQRANGVFLWAQLIVKQVLGLARQGINVTEVKKIEAKIRLIPQELDILYRQLIQSMSPDSVKLIQWICFATQPLSLDELRWAMLVDVDCPYQTLDECQTAGDYPSEHNGMKRQVQTLSCGLSEIASDTETVQFIHQSVKDFFIEKGLSVLDGSTRDNLVNIDINGKDSYGRTPLSWAAEYGHEAVVRLLLDRGAHIEAADEEGRTSLLWAAENGHEAVVELLLDRGANTEAADKKSRTPLLWAAKNGHEAVVRLLLDRGANIEAAGKWGTTPLSWAAEYGHEAVVRLLLDRGAHIEAADEEGRTSLLWASKNGREVVVRLLLDRGAHIEAADEEGRTSLLWAAENGRETVVRLLLDRGAHIEAADEEGRTSLWWVVYNEHGMENEDVVKLLLDRGAHIEAADEEGRTPLWWAAESGDEAVVRLLLDRGANTEVADEEGRTSVWWASKNGREAVVRLLQIHIAQPLMTALP
ncbi:hypothetical protein CSAL01_04545 [Colletotrichum salicis]|uniref:NACHT domain-containing protein n=1 Tax=Colletotrichum salicis TaxID=1209931 RepID=A0A135USR8_9PEZI|nr:hypothetical protein CSAL01_04545 [Colletotrichum salicis]